MNDLNAAPSQSCKGMGFPLFLQRETVQQDSEQVPAPCSRQTASVILENIETKEIHDVTSELSCITVQAQVKPLLLEIFKPGS